MNGLLIVGVTLVGFICVVWLKDQVSGNIHTCTLTEVRVVCTKFSLYCTLYCRLTLVFLTVILFVELADVHDFSFFGSPCAGYKGR